MCKRLTIVQDYCTGADHWEKTLIQYGIQSLSPNTHYVFNDKPAGDDFTISNPHRNGTEPDGRISEVPSLPLAMQMACQYSHTPITPIFSAGQGTISAAGPVSVPAADTAYSVIYSRSLNKSTCRMQFCW